MTQLPTLTERHYSAKEIAELWGLSPAAIRRLFRDEPGVLCFGKEKARASAGVHDPPHSRQYSRESVSAFYDPWFHA